MTTIAFFNNKGGVGKTSLVYHLAYMFADLGVRVVAADLDPQANLTAISLPNDELDRVEDGSLRSIFPVVEALIGGDPPVAPHVQQIDDNFGLVPGDLRLSDAEDALSSAWSESLNDQAPVRRRGLRLTSSMARAVRDASNQFGADLALVDVGPNLGPINRAALLAADHVVIPVAPDVFSLQGLENVGRSLERWRNGWAGRAAATEPPSDGWPVGRMTPAGYVVSRFTVYAGDKARHFSRWINRVPSVYHREIMADSSPPPATVDDDPQCLAWLKDYHSLMAMAHESRKPVFRLRPADGAIGGHQQAVSRAYHDFRDLAYEIAERIGFQMPRPFDGPIEDPTIPTPKLL